MAKKDEILKILSAGLRRILESAKIDFELLQELRLRMMEPFIIIYDGQEFLFLKRGLWKKERRKDMRLHRGILRKPLNISVVFPYMHMRMKSGRVL